MQVVISPEINWLNVGDGNVSAGIDDSDLVRVNSGQSGNFSSVLTITNHKIGRLQAGHKYSLVNKIVNHDIQAMQKKQAWQSIPDLQ